MNQAGQPDWDSASGPFLSDEDVKTSVPISCIASYMLSEDILLHPVNLKVPERNAIPLSDNRKRVGLVESICQKFLIILSPESAHTRLLHPHL
jgi:hypothetical protein